MFILPNTTTNTNLAYIFGTQINTILETNVFDDSIEIIYNEFPVYPTNLSTNKVFKIIYSCEDGKWNVSDKIYGTIIPATHETYEF
jgi:hypothetical protein